MSDLRKLVEKFGIARKRWFANLIESKGLTKIEDIEHELKHADENYLLDEAVEYKKLKERYKDPNSPEILAFEKQAAKNVRERDEEIKEILAEQRKRIKLEEQQKKALKALFGFFAAMFVITCLSNILIPDKDDKTDKKDVDTAEVTPTPKPTETPKPTPSATPKPTSTPEPTPEAGENPATPVHQTLYESDSPELQKWIYNYDCDWDGAKDFFESHYGDTIKFDGNVLDAYSDDGTYYTLTISAGNYGNTSATIAFVAEDIYACDGDGITDGYNPPSLTKKNYCITAEVGSFDKSAGRCFIELKKLESR